MTASPLIRVMSFNIRYGTAPDGEHRWENRRALALARIHAFAPDLLGLQECRDDAQAEFVRSHLPAYEFYGVRREGGGDSALEMAPLLFRRAAFQLRRAGHFWLSDTPAVPGSKSWDSTFARTAVWAELLHIPTGRPLTFLNTHFDYQPAAIAEAARLLRAWLAHSGPPAPVIVTGDFNADQASPAYRLLADSEVLFDAYRLAHPGSAAEPTFHGFGAPAARQAIDWILVSGHFAVAEAAVDQTSAAGQFPSDHYPLLAVLNWKA
ncbi:MAG: endonuclease/exonuclease/phosphatase family protein [Anaerolineales bacterium]|nr:endonuclease/exonuclease/phosphatase family protein [Anaerolineales bacterium]